MDKYNSNNAAEQLINKIHGFQSPGNRFFQQGIFPVYRELPVFWYRRADDNIYYSTLISLIVQTATQLLPQELRSTAEKICAGVAHNFPKYRSRSGEPLYGFYRTEPGGHYPHGWLLNRFDSLKLPDDADDTALIYMAQPHSERDVSFFKEKLAYHSNLKRNRRVKRTMPEFEQLPAYSTWFGSERVYVDFDMGVMSNILWFVFSHHLPVNRHDEASLHYLKVCFKNKYYASHSFIVSPWYPDPDVILYHLARMTEAALPEIVGDLHQNLIEVLHRRLKEDLHPLRRIFLATAIMRLTHQPEPAPLDQLLAKPAQMKGFTWGATPILYTIDWLYNISSRRLRQIISAPALNYRFDCPAHNVALLLEYWAYFRKTSE